MADTIATWPAINTQLSFNDSTLNSKTGVPTKQDLQKYTKSGYSIKISGNYDNNQLVKLKDLSKFSGANCWGTNNTGNSKYNEKIIKFASYYAGTGSAVNMLKVKSSNIAELTNNEYQTSDLYFQIHNIGSKKTPDEAGFTKITSLPTGYIDMPIYIATPTLYIINPKSDDNTIRVWNYTGQLDLVVTFHPQHTKAQYLYYADNGTATAVESGKYPLDFNMSVALYYFNWIFKN